MTKPNRELSRAEVLNFDAVIRSMFAVHVAMRTATKLAERIKFPNIPASFSENIVRLAAHRLFPSYRSYSAAFGSGADVLLSPPPRTGPRGSTKVPLPVVKVEVKATGASGTLELKQRDVQADILTWIAFGNYFESGSGLVSVYVLLNPKDNRRVQGIVRRVAKLDDFVDAAGTSPQFSTHRYRKLGAFI